MLTRILSAAVGAAVFLALCFGSPLGFALGVTAVTAVAAMEMISTYGAALAAQPAQRRAFGFAVSPWLNPVLAFLGCLYPLLAYGSIAAAAGLPRSQQPGWRAAVPSAAVALLACILLCRAWRRAAPLGKGVSAYGFFAHVYTGLPLSALVLLRGLSAPAYTSRFGHVRAHPFGAWIVLLTALCVWLTDTCAYFVGSTLGKHKLAPQISPGKTVEGAIGGLLGALVTGAAVGAALGVPPMDGLAVGLLAGLFGQAGDLFESALKREIGVKDFGRIMPGHGGVLDRFDSMIFVAPIVDLYLRARGYY